MDELKKEDFQDIHKKLTSYKGLETFGLELVSFDLEDVKSEIMEIFNVHADTLKNLWLGRNKVTH